MEKPSFVTYAHKTRVKWNKSINKETLNKEFFTKIKALLNNLQAIFIHSLSMISKNTTH